MGNMFHHAHIMCHKHIGQSELLLQIHQQIDDLRLNRHIQSGNRLIAGDKLRIHGKRAANADTLSASAGEFMRIGHTQPP